MELTPHEYYCMTRAEFILKANGYDTKQVKEWEHTRFMAYNTYKFVPYRGKGNKPVKIEKFLPLRTDTNSLNISTEERRERWLRLKKNESKNNR